MSANKRDERLGEVKYNNQGDLMKIIEYNRTKDILVEFQDEYRYKTKSNYTDFQKGAINNKYHPSLLGVGILGERYPTLINKKKN